MADDRQMKHLREALAAKELVDIEKIGGVWKAYIQGDDGAVEYEYTVNEEQARELIQAGAQG